MAKKDLQIAIMHGHSAVHKKVAAFVRKCGYTPRILIDEYEGETIFEHLRDIIWEEIHGVIVIMSADDEMKKGKFRARQNVVFELGYCFGAFDSMTDEDGYNAIILLKEKDVEEFADIHGLKYLEFAKENITPIKPRLKKALDKMYKHAKEFYPKDFK